MLIFFHTDVDEEFSSLPLLVLISRKIDLRFLAVCPSDNIFNFARFAQIIDNDETELMNIIPFRSPNDEGLKADWSKRSTAELFARVCWLNSLQGYNKDIHRERYKAADTSGAAGQLRLLRAALKKRGFIDKEIP